MREKTLNEWSIVDLDKPNTYKSLVRGCTVVGTLANGKKMKTSKVVEIYKDKIKTTSGSTYVLLRPSDGYQDWVNKRDEKIQAEAKKKDDDGDFLNETWQIL